MATLRDIKRRIVGVKNTQQITKAMKMVAAARLRRAQENMTQARPYSRKILETLNDLMALEKEINNPLFQKREVKKIAILCVTSDRGLCGAFNMNVIRNTEMLIMDTYADYNREGNLHLYCIGKKANDYFSKRDVTIAAAHIGVMSQLKFEFAASIVSQLTQKYIAGEYDKVLLVHNEFKSVIQQKLTETQLLPIEALEGIETKTNHDAEFLFEPGKTEIFDYLIPKHLNAQFWRILLESYAAELGARMTAMDMATENAKEMIRSLQLTFNKVRQAAITKELLEIVSGADALKSSS